MCRSRSRAVGSWWGGLLAGLLVFGLAASPCLAQALGAPRNDTVYEVFVRSFCDGDDDSHHIGDLKGVTKKLDPYLNDGKPETDKDLEVGVLWLMPVFPSPSYHGYDVTDYRGIHPDYGTIDDFKDLISQAHKRGVRVILDIPFNHTSDKHPWFRDALQKDSSPYRKYYHFQPDEGPPANGWYPVVGPGGRKERYFGLFSPVMPDLDFNNPSVRQEVKDVAKYWLDLGADGFRLDAAKHIFGDTFGNLTEPMILRNNDWWHDFSDYIYKIKPDAMIVGEVLGDTETLRRHAWGLDGLLDEPFMNQLRSQAAAPAPGYISRYKQFVSQARELHRSGFNPTLGFPDQPFQSFDYLASHDRNPRFASDLDEMKSRGLGRTVDEAYRVGASILLSASSRPILYQGDEVMQKGWKWNGNPPNANPPGDGSGIFDETLREPFPWYKSGDGDGQTKWFASRFDQPNDGVSVEEEDHSGTVFDLVRGLTNLRADHPVLDAGDAGEILNDTQDWMVFERTTGADRYLVLFNMTTDGHNYNFHPQWFPRYVGAQLLFWSDGESKTWKNATKDGQNINDSVYVPPYGLVIIRQKNGH